MSYVYLSFPFTFEYAQGGNYISLFARSIFCEQIEIKTFDLFDTRDKIMLYNAFINISRIFHYYSILDANKNLKFKYKIGETIEHPDGPITFFSNHALKTLRYKQYDLEVLKEIYNLTRIGSIRNTVICQIKTIKTKTIEIEIAPLCYESEQFIISFEILLNCCKNILDALYDLHSFDFVHLDVRWPNIFYDRKNGVFLLADYEYAQRNNQEIKREKMKAHFGIQFKDKIYHKLHDIICFGRLINSKFNNLCYDRRKASDEYDLLKKIINVFDNINLKSDLDKEYEEFQTSIKKLEIK